MHPGIKIATGAGILYFLYRKYRVVQISKAQTPVLAQPKALPAPDSAAVTDASTAVGDVSARTKEPVAARTKKSGDAATKATSTRRILELVRKTKEKNDIATDDTSATQDIPDADTADAVVALEISNETEAPVPEGVSNPAVRLPTQQDLVAEIVVEDARPLLNTPQVRKQLSPTFARTMDRVQPNEILFDYLPEDVKTLLLRGFAADYVQPKSIPEPGYSAAVQASTLTGLPIGWTQMLVARGVKPEDVTKVATDMISVLTGVAQDEALVSAREGRSLNLKGIRTTLMGRFAPLPEGVRMGE